MFTSVTWTLSGSTRQKGWCRMDSVMLLEPGARSRPGARSWGQRGWTLAAGVSETMIRSATTSARTTAGPGPGPGLLSDRTHLREVNVLRPDANTRFSSTKVVGTGFCRRSSGPCCTMDRSGKVEAEEVESHCRLRLLKPGPDSGSESCKPGKTLTHVGLVTLNKLFYINGTGFWSH